MNRIIASGQIDGINMERMERDAAFNMPTKHFHDEFEIYYLVKGSRYYFIENQTYLVGAGSLVLIHQQQIHKTTSPDDSYHDRILIELHEAPLKALFSRTDSLSLSDLFSKYQGVVELNEKERLFVERLLFSMLYELKNKPPHYDTQVRLKLCELIIFMSRILPNHPAHNPMFMESPRHQKVNEVSDYIANHYADTMSLENLSDRFYLNKSYLSRIFKEITGFTVNEYINITRIKQARHLLIETNWAMSQISEAIGYDSLTYFERIFKKHVETTPLRYRKKMQTGTTPLRDRLDESPGYN